MTVAFDHARFVRNLSAADWLAKAACTGADQRLFFTERGEQTGPARAICAGCGVRSECLEFAVTNKEAYGIWGGRSERERRRIRAAR